MGSLVKGTFVVKLLNTSSANIVTFTDAVAKYMFSKLPPSASLKSLKCTPGFDPSTDTPIVDIAQFSAFVTLLDKSGNPMTKDNPGEVSVVNGGTGVKGTISAVSIEQEYRVHFNKNHQIELFDSVEGIGGLLFTPERVNTTATWTGTQFIYFYIEFVLQT